MKILLIGKNGQVGSELNNLVGNLGTLVALEREQLDLSHPNRIEPKILDIRPDIIINAAAYTAVDKAEKEPDMAMAVNGAAPAMLAKAAKTTGAGLIHFSTDYVFDGRSDIPYKEETPTCPLSIYGKSKLEGEKAIIEAGIPFLILRTAWVYSVNGNSFLKSIRKLAEEKETLRIVNDQTGSPTWAHSIALATRQILKQCITKNWLKKEDPFLSGIFHLTCQGKTSWYGFAKEILNISGAAKKTRLFPIPTSDYPTPAARPLYSILSNDKAKKIFNVQLPLWKDALKNCLASS